MKTNNKQFKSSTHYMDALQQEYSKLNIIRTDLSYLKEYSADITLEQVNSDIDRLLNNTRNKPSIFKHQVGYIFKREHTEDKGVHVHALFAFDGQKVKSDVHKADQIGNYWANEITKGKGIYHNCNLNDYDQNGIGMLNRNDSEKRKILDVKVIVYLCKEDQDVTPLKGSKKERAFTRGTLPKKKKKGEEE